MGYVDRCSQWLKTLLTRLQPLPSAGFSTPAQTARALRREQALANRTGRGFSLLVVALDEMFDEMSDKPANNDRVARAIGHRLRVTDETGWVDHAHLGIVLPATRPAGAEVLAQDIQRIFRDQGQSTSVCIYYYPAEIVAEQESRVTASSDDRNDVADLVAGTTPKSR